MERLTYIFSFDNDISEKAKGVLAFWKGRMEFRTREKNGIVIYDIKWEFKVIEDVSVALHQDVKSQLQAGKRNFLFNLKDVAYMDSDGLGEILGSYISISKLGGKLKLMNLVPKILIMFKAAGLMKIFEIFDDEETAIEDFSA